MYSKNIDALHRMARVVNCSIFVKNGPNFAGLGWGGEGPTSFTIASPTGEGMTTAGQVCAYIGVLIGLINCVAGIAIQVGGLGGGKF